MTDVVIGKGTYGTVVRSTYQNVPCATKICHEEDPTSTMEIILAYRLVHPCIVKVFNVSIQSPKCFITMELADESLLDYMQKYTLCPRSRLQIYTNIRDALMHMHSIGYMHRDVKPGNIILFGQTAKLCDFGMAAELCDCRDYNVVTVHYRAPEVFERRPYTHTIDVWALGCVLYEMRTQRPLFPREDMVYADIMNLNVMILTDTEYKLLLRYDRFFV